MRTNTQLIANMVADNTDMTRILVADIMKDSSDMTRMKMTRMKMSRVMRKFSARSTQRVGGFYRRAVAYARMRFQDPSVA